MSAFQPDADGHIVALSTIQCLDSLVVAACTAQIQSCQSPILNPRQPPSGRLGVVTANGRLSKHQTAEEVHTGQVNAGCCLRWIMVTTCATLPNFHQHMHACDGLLEFSFVIVAVVTMMPNHMQIITRISIIHFYIMNLVKDSIEFPQYLQKA
ncbi:hypothetical protein ABBQ32_004343 [Trebouxia sp. C0010 RCD-2024]